MRVDQTLYRKAFQAYLRKGTPIEWSIKQDRPTTHYVWRTRGDDNVRPSHAANDGMTFAWDDPPPTGNPGESFGCRCTAEPIYSEALEYITITLSGVADTGPPWGSKDFVRHYYRGRGRGVTVRETGHLTQIVDRYMGLAAESIKAQIIAAARKNKIGEFSDGFYRSYGMTSIAFSIGDTTIGGSFVGRSSEKSGLLTISGTLEFYLRDEFIDPLDIGIEVIDLGETIAENLQRPFEDYLRGRVGIQPTAPQRLGVHTGEPYAITDAWSGDFEGQIYADPKQSIFVDGEADLKK